MTAGLLSSAFLIGKEKMFAKFFVFTFSALIFACTPLSSNVKSYNRPDAPLTAPSLPRAKVSSINRAFYFNPPDTSEVIRTATGCRYYQTETLIPTLSFAEPLKFVHILAAELNKAKKSDSKASLSCRRDGNDMIYTVSSKGSKRGFSFGYRDGKLILNGISVNGNVRKCATEKECASAFLAKNKSALGLR